MREIRIRDGSHWQLETLLADAPKGRKSRRQVSQTRTWVWVRCISGMREHRLMFAATWELWPDAVLAHALEEEISRATTATRADEALPATPPAPPPRSTGSALSERLARGRNG